MSVRKTSVKGYFSALYAMLAQIELSNTMKQTPTDQKAYQRKVQRFIKDYDQASALYHEIADRLLDRLPLMRFTPEVVLDIGAKDGYATQHLTQHYPEAEVHAVESNGLWFEQYNPVFNHQHIHTHVGQNDALPMANESVDCIVSNLTLSWSNDFQACLQDWQRVLKPEGLILFSCLGVDTLQEYRQAMQQIGIDTAVHGFTDMHWVGDSLLSQGFVDPVMHMETLTVHYRSIDALCRDLRCAMAANVRLDRSRGCLTPRQWQAMTLNYQSLCDQRGRFPVTFEIIYGHALAPKKILETSQNQPSEHIIPVDQLTVRSSHKDEE